MTSTQLFKGLSYIDSGLLTEAEQRMSAPVRKPAARPRHTLLAAVICLITLLLAGCGVLYMLRLQNLKIGTQTIPLPQDSAAEPASEESVSELLVFSLQGAQNSPNFLANQEWLTFTQNYTPVLGDYWDSPEEYWAYSVQDQKMVDKLEEICAKYGLKVIGKSWHEHADCNQFLSLLGVDSLLRPNADATLQIPHGRFFPGGSFTIYGSVSIAGTDCPLDLTYHCVKKDVFYDVFGYVDPNSVTQRNVTTPEGIPLLLLESENSGMILADKEDCFLSLSVSLTEGVSLEQVADCFNFAIQTSPPDAAAAQAREQESIAQTSMNLNPRYTTFQSYIEARLSTDAMLQAEMPDYTPPKKEYAFYDLDGNGVDDLLIFYDGYIGAILVMKDGEVNDGKSYYMTLCEDNVLIHISDYGNGETMYHIFQFANDGDPVFSNPKERSIVRLLKNADGTWQRTSSTDHYAEFDTEITEEEALSILNAYTPIQLDTRPLSQFQEPND